MLVVKIARYVASNTLLEMLNSAKLPVRPAESDLRPEAIKNRRPEGALLISTNVVVQTIRR